MELLENVELRFGLADNSEKFSQTLHLLLCPLLLKLADPQDFIRQKVLQILTHLNKRIRYSSDVILPVSDLVSLWLSNENNTVQSFALVYADLGIGRISAQERSICISRLISGYSKKHSKQKMTIFSIIQTYLSDVHIDYSNIASADITAIFNSFMHVLLHTPGNLQSISQESLDFISNNGKITSFDSFKLPILQLLSKVPKPTALEDLERLVYVLFIVASTDTNHLVSEFADDAIKKRGRPDLDDPHLAARLYSLYLGNQNTQTSPATLKRPVGLNLKYKILNILSKSSVAPNLLPYSLQTIFDALFSPDSNAKVRLAGMGFAQWTIRMSKDQVLHALSTNLLSGILKIIDESNEHSKDLKSFAYGSLAALARRNPSLFQENFALVETLFHSLSSESADIRPSIQEALVSLGECLKSTKSKNMAALRKLIIDHLDSEHHAARFCAVKYAATLLEENDSFAKFVFLVASSDGKLETREIARNGLRFIKGNLPSFHEFVDLFEHYALKNDDTELLPSRNVPMKELFVSSQCLLEFIRYAKVLIFALVDSSVLDEKGSYNFLTNSIELEEINDYHGIDLKTKSRLCEWYSSNSKESSMNKFMKLIRIGAEDSSHPLLQVQALASYRDYVMFTKEISDRPARIDFLNSYLSHSKLEARTFSAHSIALLISFDLGDSEALLQALNDKIKSKDVNRGSEDLHGSILCFGFLTGRLLFRHIGFTPKNLPIDVLVSFINSENLLMASASLTALSEIFRHTSISSFYADDLCQDLKKIIETAKDNKIAEQTIQCLGQLCLGDASLCTTVMKIFLDMASSKSKQPELQLTIGEALSMVLGGWQSSFSQSLLDLWDTTFPHTEEDRKFAHTIDTLIREYFIENVKPPATKRSVSIWLLSIVKFCGHLSVINDRLVPIHRAFNSMLGDKDEFVQEIASKGIGLIYTLGNETVKSDLVKTLVGSFADDASVSQFKNINEETEIFEPGTLGTAPDGSNVTTYKELCSLASEMNKPDLVYKFMSLASHNKLWSTRKGAAFGFSEILRHAQKELEYFLPDLIPKLYRYCHDPNAKVSASMKNIWESIVPKPRETIDEYFTKILQDLLKAMVDRQWRTRESSCNALSELISGRDMLEFIEEIEKIWNLVFRALDDIKESVRVAAFKTCRTITNMTIRYCEPSNVSEKNGSKIMAIIVPYMLEKGILSTAEDVRKFALTTILTLCKKSGSLLKPYCSDIIANLLEGMSSMEPQVMNYLSFHVDKYDMTQDELDNSRMIAAKMSPMMNAIELCVEYLDQNQMQKLCPILLNLIRKGVGLPTKGGAARFIAIVCIKTPHIFQESTQTCDSIVKAVSGALVDRSTSLRRAYATAAGYILKYCSEQQRMKFLEHFNTIYCDHEEKEYREASALMYREFAKHSSDCFKASQYISLPYVYFGTFDIDNDLQGLFKDVWESNTGGTATALKVHMKEIIEIVLKNLDNPSWSIKIQSAKCITKAAELVESGIDVYMERVLNSLMSSLAGRTWDGKEFVLQALVDISINRRSHVEAIDGLCNKIILICLKESKRNKYFYKRYAVDYLGKFLLAFPNIQMFTEVSETVMSMARKTEFDEDEIDEEHKSKPIFNLVRGSSFKALGAAWRKGNDIIELISLFTDQMQDITNPWNVRQSVVEGFASFLETMSVSQMILPQDLFEKSLAGLLSVLKDGKYASLREEAANCLKSLKKVTAPNLVPSFEEQMRLIIGLYEESPVIYEFLKKLIN